MGAILREALPGMRARRRGTIVTVSSMDGIASLPANGFYSASKFALTAFADALRLEEGDRIRVASLHPGRTDTDMQRELQEALGHPYRPADFLRPESVAALVRAVVDLPADAQVDSLRVRPTGR